MNTLNSAWYHYTSASCVFDSSVWISKWVMSCVSNAQTTQPHCLHNSNQSDWIWLVVGCQGNDSTSDEQGAAAAAAVQLDDKFNGEPIQIRVCEGKEPDHFFSIFNRQLLIYQVNLEKSDRKQTRIVSFPSKITKIKRYFLFLGGSCKWLPECPAIWVCWRYPTSASTSCWKRCQDCWGTRQKS